MISCCTNHDYAYVVFDGWECPFCAVEECSGEKAAKLEEEVKNLEEEIEEMAEAEERLEKRIAELERERDDASS